MWESVWQLLQKMDKEEYVFLRNADGISDDFNESDDWDLLCNNIKRFTQQLKLKPLHDGRFCFNYYTMVHGNKLLLDIRCVGDGYYDMLWEREMLKARKREKFCYVLDHTQQKFSVLYHCLIQKSATDAEKYKQYILDNFGIYDIPKNLQQLADYMKCHNQCH